MASFIDALNNAVYGALTGDATLMSMVTGVYSHVPQDTSYPYIVIGDVSSNDLSTMKDDGQQYSCRIHVWSQYKGSYETATILDRIHTVLHRTQLSVAGANTATAMLGGVTLLRDPDGLTWHGVGDFTITVME